MVQTVNYKARNKKNARAKATTETPETVTLLSETGSNHPLAHLAGKYGGEEWEDILREIKRNRQEGIGDGIDE